MVDASASLSSDRWFESGWPSTDSQTSAYRNGWLGSLDGMIMFNVVPSPEANLPEDAKVS